MSASTDPQPPAEPGARAQPRTQELPVVKPAAAQQLPPHPAATTPPPVESRQATGRVDVVPGLPGTPPPPPPPAATAGSTTADAPTAANPSPGPDSFETTRVPLGGDPPPAAPPVAAARDRRALLGLGLVGLSLVLLELGLSLRFGGDSFWSDIPLWSAFATVCAVLGLAGSASLLPGARLAPATAWRIAAGGLVGLAVFWLLVVLPVVASDRGFLLTAALGALGAALWTGPARRD